MKIFVSSWNSVINCLSENWSISELFWLTEMFHPILESLDQVESAEMWAGVLVTS